MKPNLSAFDPSRPIKVAYATLTRRARETRSERLTSPMTSVICLNMLHNQLCDKSLGYICLITNYT